MSEIVPGREIKEGLTRLGYFFMILAFAVPIVMVAMLARISVNVPFWDDWATSELVVAMDRHLLTFADLWAQHNEHRMFVPNVIMMILAKMGGWNLTHEILFSAVLVICSQVVLYALLRRTISGLWLAIAFALVTFCLYSTAQAENWLWGFQIAWFLIELFMLAMVWLLTASRVDFRMYATAVAICFLASFTMSSGLNLWAVGLAILLIRRSSEARITLWILASIGTAALYFHGWSKSGLQTNPAYGLTHPVELIGYVFAYLGSGFGSWFGLAGAIVLGVLVLVAFCKLTLTYFFEHGRSIADPEIAWISVGMFSVLSACMTAVGRSAFGLGQSLAGRYTTFSDLLWIATIALIARSWYCGRGTPTVAHWRVLRVTAIAALFLVIVRVNVTGMEEMKRLHDNGKSALAILMHFDTATDEQLTHIFPDANALRTFAGDLRSVRDGPFKGMVLVNRKSPNPAGPPSLRPGNTADSIDEISDDGVETPVNSMTEPLTVKRGSALSIRGWAVDAPAESTAGGVLVLIRGSRPIRANYGESRPDVATALGNPSYVNSGFVAKVDTKSLAPGLYSVRFEVLTADRTGYYLIPRIVKLRVTRGA